MTQIDISQLGKTETKIVQLQDGQQMVVTISDGRMTARLAVVAMGMADDVIDTIAEKTAEKVYAMLEKRRQRADKGG